MTWHRRLRVRRRGPLCLRSSAAMAMQATRCGYAARGAARAAASAIRLCVTDSLLRYPSSACISLTRRQNAARRWAPSARTQCVAPRTTVRVAAAPRDGQPAGRRLCAFPKLTACSQRRPLCAAPYAGASTKPRRGAAHRGAAHRGASRRGAAHCADAAICAVAAGFATPPSSCSSTQTDSKSPARARRVQQRGRMLRLRGGGLAGATLTARPPPPRSALKKMQAGVDKLATVVGVTLGPKGRNVSTCVLSCRCRCLLAR